MASKELLDMLNKAVARELQVSIQYMWQHVLWKGPEGFAVKDVFKETAITEMKHAEEIAERYDFLGGNELTTKPEPIFVGKNLKEMLEQDKNDEQGAIELYRKIIKKAQEEDDVTTARMFRRILEDEEDHLDTFEGILEGM